LITKKFNYATISRTSIEGKRHYLTPDGNAVPSVTTILDITKPAEKKRALAEWKKRVGTERAQQITTEAANRGTRMHTYLEGFVETGELKPRPGNPFAWPSHAMAAVVIDKGLSKADEFWGSEVSLYFPGVYAGTTDLVGVHQGVPAIMDFKQTNKPKKEEWIEDYYLQLAAYALAHDEIFGTEINKGVILMCVKPKLDEAGAILEAPEYQEFIVEGAEFKHWKTQWWKRCEEYYTRLSNNEL
jgi:ATP-dependent exoDNAse (exonuclease V) beta subunit